MTPIDSTSVSLHEDARITNTRRRLVEAVLQLASEKSITNTSVLEITQRAGINRSTFYAHADSPMQLLTRALSAELDEVYRAAMEEIERDGLLYRDLTRHAMNQIADHVIRHEAVYAGSAHGSSLFALRVVLAEHVERSVLNIFREGFSGAPVCTPEAAMLYAGFLSHGIAGAFEAWLRLPAPRNRELLLSAVEAMYPSWYAPESHRAKPAKASPAPKVHIEKQ